MDHLQETHIPNYYEELLDWVMSILYISEISFSQLIVLYWRVILFGVCVDVVCVVDFVESKYENAFQLKITAQHVA